MRAPAPTGSSALAPEPLAAFAPTTAAGAPPPEDDPAGAGPSSFNSMPPESAEQ